ncbi:MAG: hypothetical protein ACRYGK_12650 [Janthinobacterium lividum]
MIKPIESIVDAECSALKPGEQDWRAYFPDLPGPARRIVMIHDGSSRGIAFAAKPLQAVGPLHGWTNSGKMSTRKHAPEP